MLVSKIVLQKWAGFVEIGSHDDDDKDVVDKCHRWMTGESVFLAKDAKPLLPVLKKHGSLPRVWVMSVGAIDRVCRKKGGEGTKPSTARMVAKSGLLEAGEVCERTGRWM